MFENDQRDCGNRRKVLSAKRINLSAGGGAPTIHPIATGSLSRAVNTRTSADVTEPSLIVVVFIGAS